jgi:hypothetical protein
MVYLGVVKRVQSNNGSVYVHVQNGFELDELHNVAISSPADNEFLAYDSGTSLWKNQTAAEAGVSVVGHVHSATDITSGALDVARGGTGLTTGSGLVPIVPTSATNGSVGATGTVTFSSQTSVSLNGAFTTAYTRYRVFVDYNTASMTGNDATWLLRNSGSNVTASNYAFAGRRHISWSASDIWGIGGSGWLLMNGNTQSGTYTQSYIDIMYPRQTSRTFISLHSYLYGPTHYGSLIMAGQYNATTAVDGFTITFSASSSGTVKVYGYN